MEYEYDTYEYETLQDEIAIEMMSEAIREQWQMEAYESDSDDFYPDDDDRYWCEDDRHDRWAEVENREMLDISAYSHWNEEAPLMWWLEEGRFQ